MLDLFELPAIIRKLRYVPEQLDEIKEIVMTSAQNAQEQAQQLLIKVNALGASLGGVATVVGELRSKIAAQNDAIQGLRDGTVSADTLAEINASVDKSVDQIAQLVAPAVDDTDVDTGSADTPPATNPDTPDPSTVPTTGDAPASVTDPSSVEVGGDGAPVSTDDGSSSGPLGGLLGN